MNSDVAVSALPASRAPVMVRIAGAIDLVVETVAAALFVRTVAIALIQVFWRYVLNNSLSWPEEMVELCVHLVRVSRCRDGDAPLAPHRDRSYAPFARAGRLAHPCVRGP